MHPLLRSSKRVLAERHLRLASSAQSRLPPLFRCPQFGKTSAWNNILQTCFDFVEGPIHHDGCFLARLAQHMQDVFCDNSKPRSEPLERPASEPASEAAFKFLSKADDRKSAFLKKWLGFVTKVELDWQETDGKLIFSQEEGFSDRAVADSTTTFSRPYRSSLQAHIELVGASNSLNLGLSGTWKAFSYNIKKEFHSLTDEIAGIDVTMRPSGEIECRQVSDDKAIQGDAKVRSEKGNYQSTEKQVLKPSIDITENFDKSLQREDKVCILSESASKSSLMDSASLLDERNQRANRGYLYSLYQNDTASKMAISVKSQESLGSEDTSDANVPKMELKENQSNNLEQKVSKQVDCVEHLEEGDTLGKSDLGGDLQIMHTKPLKELFHEQSSSESVLIFPDLDANFQMVKGISPSPTHLVSNMQKSDRDMVLSMHKSRHAMQMNGSGKDACNETASVLIENSGELIVNEYHQASTSSCSFSKSWTNAQILLEKGMDIDLCDYADASKVQDPSTNLDFKNFYIILDLNGVLIKRWDVNPSLPGVIKLNKRWIQLRPGCIEFLCKIFSEFRVGIWSTMRQKNVLGVCKFLEQQAHQPLPFFMLWSKDFCYQHRGIRRPDKSHVLADFKPLSRVWNFFKPYLGSHNTVLIDDSPYKACMNNPCNCVFPDAYEGSINDNYLNNVLWPYLQKMKVSQEIQTYIANNPLGQQPIVVGHRLYYHVQQVMDVFHSALPTGTVELSVKH